MDREGLSRGPVPISLKQYQEILEDYGIIAVPYEGDPDVPTRFGPAEFSLRRSDQS